MLYCRGCFVKRNGKEINALSYSFPGGLGFPRVTETIPNELSTEVDKIPYWKIALADAKHSVFTNNYRQAIVHVNIALEAFLHEMFYKKMQGKMTQEEIENFLNPKDGNHPSKYKILKLIYKGELSNKQYENTIEEAIKEKITKYRDMIVHGRDHPIISKQDAESAICTLEGLIQGRQFTKE